MRSASSLRIALLVAVGVACSSVRTHYDFDPRTDFAAWRTYAWYRSASAPSGDPRLDSELLHARIEAAVDRTLAAQGFAPVRDRPPDFYVNYHLSTEQRLDVRTIDRAYVGGPHGRRWAGAGWGGVGWTETRVDQYEEGTLVIDFVDASARRLAWRGSGTRRLARDFQPERVTERVNEAVEEILAQFPPE
jgi:hypothetical protein